MKLPVLDRGFVNYVQHMGSDLTVVNAARVSFAKSSQQFTQKDAKLVTYLKKHNHWTPFGHCALTVHMKMPIFVARQWMRSNVGIVYNQISRRYVDTPPEFYSPLKWRGRPDGSIKQGSSDTQVKYFNKSTGRYLYIAEVAEDSWAQQASIYEDMIASGVAPQLARMNLPVNTYTELWMTASLPACLRLIGLREDGHAQWQIQEYARALKQIVSKYFPASSIPVE